LVTDLSKLATVYMNNSGCNILKHSVEELAEQGPEYFQQFFVPEEIGFIIPSYLALQQKQDAAAVFNFVHRVKPLDQTSYKWYFASAKLMYNPDQAISNKILLVVNEVNAAGYIAKKINSVLEESEWMKKHFSKFCRLTRREKDMITLIASGKTSRQAAEILQITRLTANTHRRNIAQKLETKTFAELYRFAVAFELIVP
jgi:DNA-binding CsgD family transcriptional regulator